MGLGTFIVVILGIALYSYGLVLFFIHVKKTPNKILSTLPFLSIGITIIGISGFIIYNIFILLSYLNKIQLF